MKHAFLIAAAAAMVAACGAPQQISGPGDPSASLVDASRLSRNASDAVRWTAYRTFTFDTANVEVSASDMPKVYEIVEHLRQNPSLDVGIDGTLGAQAVNDDDRILGNQRAAAVRRALMDAGAGIASYKIFSGAFSDPDRRRVGQVQILVGPRTGSLRASL